MLKRIQESSSDQVHEESEFDLEGKSFAVRFMFSYFSEAANKYAMHQLLCTAAKQMQQEELDALEAIYAEVNIGTFVTALYRRISLMETSFPPFTSCSEFRPHRYMPVKSSSSNHA